MSKYQVTASWVVPGTTIKLYMEIPTVAKIRDIRGTMLIDFGVDPTDEESKLGNSDLGKFGQTLMQTMLHRFFYEDEAQTTPAFAEIADVEGELNAMQMADGYLTLMRLAGMDAGVMAAARRFPDDGTGEAGGDEPARDSEGVRVSAE